MRILFYLSNLHVGGCQINAINLAIALKNRGHVVYIISDGGVLLQRLNDAEIEHLQINQNVRHFSLKNSLKIARFVRRLDIDIVQAFDPIFSIEAYTSKYFHGKQTLGMITAQRLPVFYLPKFCPTLFVNPSIIDTYINLYNWDANCTFLLKERLDLNVYFPILNNSFSYAEPCHSSKRIVTLVTRIDLDKLPSIHLFIDLVKYVTSFENMEEYVFYIAGDGPMFNDAKELIIENGLQKRLFLLGQVTKINELINASFALVAMASTCQQSLAAGKPTFVIGNSGFFQLIDASNFKEMSYFHFNIHNQTTQNVGEYFCSCLLERFNSEDFLRNYFSFAISSAKLFSSNEGAAKLEKMYQALLLKKFSLKSWVSYTFELLHSYLSYFKYLVLRKLKCVE